MSGRETRKRHAYVAIGLRILNRRLPVWHVRYTRINSELDGIALCQWSIPRRQRPQWRTTA